MLLPMNRISVVALLSFTATACLNKADYDRDGFVEPEDCNDNDSSTYPGAEETPYDGIDQDCSGADLTDVDGDGWDAREAGGNDCNDLRKRIRPDAEEIPYDGIDQNCDGWSDNDYDRDGFEAMGHGGTDCDDFDALVIPVDEDGDGFSPCDGDCDELDPERNPGRPPICGNDIEDNCDGISDCAYFGSGTLDESPIRVYAVPGELSFGRSMALSVNPRGSGVAAIVSTSIDVSGDSATAWWFDGPLPALSLTNHATGSITLPGIDPRVFALGDVDGDSRGDVMVTYDEPGSTAWLGVVTDPPSTQGVSFLDSAWMRIQGDSLDHVGSHVVGLDGGARIAISAMYGFDNAGGLGLVTPTAGQFAFGETGAVLKGGPRRFAGQALAALDFDADGDEDLLVAEAGGTFEAGFGRVVPSPPSSGVYLLSDLSVADIDLSGWGDALGGVAHADLDDDGAEDLILGTPAFSIRIGAVLIFTGDLRGALEPDEAPVQLYGTGDDTFGASLAVDDFDGDGHDDLLVGAPASIEGGGGSKKPGAFHLWYGPIEEGSFLSLQSDWYMLGRSTEGRSLAGYQVGFSDLDGDSQPEAVISSPGEGSGGIYVFPGGATALNGI
ncbi:MAG TPA: hypothetical protein ENK18_04965 [Deltaproteobacteria bacterium]|nr:hypothetical protein [Deltaproteobacteria bacterium]